MTAGLGNLPVGVSRSLISVVLPCRNAEEFLPRCIASLRAQTYPDLEIIAVDDSSHDGTLRLLDQWQQRDRRVRVLRSPSRGIVAALNGGLRAARGAWIARMDADDVASPQRFEKQLAAFRKDRRLVACGCRVRYFPRKLVRDGARRYEAWLNSLSRPAQLARDIFVECPIAHPTLMIRSTELRRLGGYQDKGWPEDYDLLLRLFLSGARMRNLPEVLLKWREREDRLSRVDPRYSAAAFRRCKVHYLLQSCLRHRHVIIWGAGPVGKAFSRELAQQGKPVQAFVDIDPRKIGQVIHDAPVLSAGQLGPRPDNAYVLAAVSGPRARSEIRASLRALGMSEGRDFIAVA